MKNFKFLILFLSLITIFEITNSKDANAGACTVTNGVYSETEIKNGCDAQPDFYEIVIFEMYLCTSAPTIPTVVQAGILSEIFFLIQFLIILYTLGTTLENNIFLFKSLNKNLFKNLSIFFFLNSLFFSIM